MIKSMLLYRVTNEDHIALLNNYIDLGEALANKPEALPTGSQWSKAGFAPLNPDVNEDLVWSGAGGVLVLNYMIHERNLTGATVREYVLERGKKIEEREGRKVYKKEYAQIKDEVLAELLPKAFIKHKRVIIMVIDNLLVIGATTAKVAENVLCDLRECMGSLPVRPFCTKVAPSAWLGDLTAHKKGLLSAGDTAKFVNDVKDVVTFKGVDLSDDEPQTYREQGFFVKELGLWFGTEMYCKVTDTLIFKGMKFSEDLIHTAYADTDGDPAATIDANILLTSDTIRKLVAEIQKQIGEEPYEIQTGMAVGARISHINGEPTGHLEDLMSDDEKLASLQEQFAGADDEPLVFEDF